MNHTFETNLHGREVAFLAALVESSHDAIISKTLEGIVSSWNDGATRLFGYTAAEIIGQPIALLIPAERADEEPEILKRISRGDRVDSYETVRRRKDGTLVDISLTISPIRDPAGNIIGASKIARDITARKQIEAQLRQLNQELERRVMERTAALHEVNHELEAFTYSVAHDLRAPLRAIRFHVESVGEDLGDAVPPALHERLNRCLGAAGRMEALIADILRLSHVGRQDLHRSELQLDTLIEEARTELAPEIAGRNIEWRIGRLPTLQGDRGLLSQVVGNLLSNALKYTRPRLHTVIEVNALEQAGAPVIVVRDNGVGFDLARASRLFEPFQRFHSPKDFEGVGVGLALVQRIIRRHGGRIWAESQVGQGTSFYFTLGTSAN